jgi:hypothetical protein
LRVYIYNILFTLIAYVETTIRPVIETFGDGCRKPKTFLYNRPKRSVSVGISLSHGIRKNVELHEATMPKAIITEWASKRIHII